MDLALQGVRQEIGSLSPLSAGLQRPTGVGPVPGPDSLFVMTGESRVEVKCAPKRVLRTFRRKRVATGAPLRRVREVRSLLGMVTELFR